MRKLLPHELEDPQALEALLRDAQRGGRLGEVEQLAPALVALGRWQPAWRLLTSGTERLEALVAAPPLDADADDATRAWLDARDGLARHLGELVRALSPAPEAALWQQRGTRHLPANPLRFYLRALRAWRPDDWFDWLRDLSVAEHVAAHPYGTPPTRELTFVVARRPDAPATMAAQARTVVLPSGAIALRLLTVPAAGQKTALDLECFHCPPLPPLGHADPVDDAPATPIPDPRRSSPRHAAPRSAEEVPAWLSALPPEQPPVRSFGHARQLGLAAICGATASLVGMALAASFAPTLSVPFGGLCAIAAVVWILRLPFREDEKFPGAGSPGP